MEVLALNAETENIKLFSLWETPEYAVSLKCSQHLVISDLLSAWLSDLKETDLLPTYWNNLVCMCSKFSALVH